ncbi:MAG: arsenosugar biosynthesis radical SAM protein ArsS [Desulfomonile tiedjei]|uniref:Arsenosugar biosynthesis radical SAM protein ArsS n=1 Tax=Desulfomonile tiedjei TaxID=2358 RepID=A0A9D6Z2N0_9BACT|nr:arsenosugar biosynthesis radical SAM protein ArsS [Desulfomonile tiedjei]
MHQNQAPTDKEASAEKIQVELFSRTLARHGLDLRKGETSTLQINVGLLCNQMCRHCHLEAGASRSELMDRDTIDEVVAYAKRARFQVVDITRGAPEMNPHLGCLIETIAPLTPRLMLRANLTALAQQDTDYLRELCTVNRVVIVASFPSISGSRTDSLRGKGVLEKSVAMLKKLNELGYGMDGTGLELNLVSNPTGAFLPVSQSQAEKRFKADLRRKWGLAFNNLFTSANVPLGRFLVWQRDSGNLESYMQKLSARFNPCTIEGLMCRTFVSVNWDGYLYDCDFNLARGAYLGGRKRHVSEMAGLPEPGTRIPTGNHCYACTAGSGFT